MMFAQTDSRSFFELAPIWPMVQSWQWALAIGVLLVLAAFSVWLCRRDTRNLPTPIAYVLLTFKLLALVGLLIFFLGPEKRSETRVVKPSRLTLLFDNSLSMGLVDPESAAGQRRIDQLVELLESTSLLEDLNQQHELTLYRFGESSKPEQFAKVKKKQPTALIESSSTEIEDAVLQRSRRIIWAGLVVVGLSLLALALSVTLRLLSKGENVSRLRSNVLALGSLGLVTSIFLLAIGDLIISQISVTQTLGSQDDRVIQAPSDAVNNDENVEDDATEEQWTDLTTIDWQLQLRPVGVATRIGSAIQEIVKQSRGSALAGIVLVTDGRSNQGTPVSRAIVEANDSNIPIYAIGVGSIQPARNVRLTELQAPGRVQPGTPFKLNAVVQAFGYEDQSVRVRLLSTDEESTTAPQTEDEQLLQLPQDGEPLSVSFEQTLVDQGTRRYIVQLDTPADDLDANDNSQSAVVQAVQRKTNVLLMAGGPTRDYRFLRNQLYRDPQVTLDVWLQTAKPGADQESDNLLFGFPNSLQDLDAYDCIVAFDPDWRDLTYQQSKLLETWIAENAGGMLVIAGPVFTPEWTRRPRGDRAIDLIRGLYPVSFFSQGSAVLKLGRFGGDRPFPLQFSRAGRSARQLRLAASAQESLASWDEFAGVYGFYAVNESKPGADVLAYFSDPTTAIDQQLPIYLSSQFYGSGRVFFQASGEVWRLRTVAVEHFQTYYTNLIRWVSEGRMLRDSKQGVLLLERNRCWVGDRIVVRAILKDESGQPMLQPQVDTTIRMPNGLSQTVTLRNIQDTTRPGSYQGQFIAGLEGNFEVILPLTSSNAPTLTATLQASVPDLEKVRPERNDVLLQEVADRTGGLFFFDFDSQGKASWLQRDTEDESLNKVTGSLVGSDGLSGRVGVVDQEIFIPGAPDQNFATKFSRWLLLWMATLFCTGWVLRRLHKLA